MPNLTPLFWLLLSFPLLLFVKRGIAQHLRGVTLLLSRSEEVASMMYFVLLLPGIVLHEGSHWLMARLLGVRTEKLSIGLSKKRGRALEMGSVRVAPADPVRNSLIGVAPLVGGSLAIFLIGDRALKLEGLAQAFQSRPAADIAVELSKALHAPDLWLWLYLIFAISNTMLPSSTDRRPWPPVLIFLAGLAAPVYFAGWVPSLPSEVTEPLLRALSHLSLAFALTLAVDLIFALFILVLELVLTRLTGWRVEY